MKPLPIRIVTLALFGASFLAAQPADDTQLKQVIVFGRHSVRAPVSPNSTLNTFSVNQYPDFGVAAGILTPNGEKLETILGGYYRLWLTQQGLLTGNDAADTAFVYFRANTLQRTIDTAQHFASGLLPSAGVIVNFYPPTAIDPLFDPVDAGVATLDLNKALAAVQGRVGDGQSLASAYASELALTRSLLLGYSVTVTPPPLKPDSVAVDVTAVPFDITIGTSILAPISVGGLADVSAAIDPFVMEYADGLPPSSVGWGQLTPAGISQTSRLYNLNIDLECRTPYLAALLASNVASHVVRSLVQAATGNAMPGSLGTPSTKVMVLIASDVNLAAFAGLFHFDWLIPGFQENYSSPGGAIVFELRQSQNDGEYIVRASYIAQTLDQLHNQTAFTLAAPPAVSPLFIPGCSTGNATFDCPLAGFVKIAKQVIDPQSADLVN